MSEQQPQQKPEQQPGRRALLRAATAGGAAVLTGTAAQPAAAASASASGSASASVSVSPSSSSSSRLRVYVLVVDGCNPTEFASVSQPRLAALRAQGTLYPAARSLPIMETVPNHVMMMSGVRPDRSGVPANAIYDRGERVVRTLDRPTDLRASTLLERLPQRGFVTASVPSKDYLVGIFGTRATHRWVPPAYLPVTGHVPDATTVPALVDIVDRHDPDLVFCNLGDIDRVGHSDPTGPRLPFPALRTADLTATDTLIGGFTDHLAATGKWASSVLVVLADHGMDFSVPTNLISVKQQALASRPDLQASVTIAQNGGADSITWTGPAGRRRQGLAEVARLVAAHPGVLSVKLPSQLRLGPEAGDLVAYARPGWRFSDPQVTSNPIPGNHGHPVTEPIPFLITGGHPGLRRGATSSAPVRTVDVAPTVAALFGLSAPRGGWDGTARLDAFTRTPRAASATW
ncbi:Predicted pyrophosphatase or phosphodiesterase, AlkP superfamily [Quadrisphaera granulorum]|uniref:Putative AlkP superfamily pyrophosphatase or phosphodiesterase n=1 Tax=Quadrisphaera granulorum TaxID=317664 RepID=A0A316ANW6_9ACTN|nr:alkaline phosphatase family protein [Quadrisphaera granulorum]PWJ51777.1 putative AlkP superfamily pyrophosphatase or phosphodiesterase [Quadrisphaera granulorum]SZE97724.1 Predicted pyrophosphatase or phosphodiesterase, AlkP superfamily [Quadrisphaera granulorum]